MASDLFYNIDIPFFVVAVGQACNFKCKNCGNFAPYAPKDMLRYNYERLEKDINKLCENINTIKILQIQGGEPFLYSDLDKLIKLAEKNDKIEKVRLATNGSVHLNSKILDVLKKCKKVEVRISAYPNVDKALLHEFEEKLKECNIEYWMYKFSSGKGYWNDMGGIKTSRENDDEVVTTRFNNCNFNSCLTLENGLIGYCSRSIIATRLQNLESNKNDFIDLSEKELNKKLYNYVSNKHFMECCRYCYGTDGELIEAAQQL